MFARSLFIFRRDLRLRDNTGLLAAAAQSKSIIPLFIVDPALLQRNRDANYRMTFLAQSLEKLDEEISTFGGRLSVLGGSPAKIIPTLLDTREIDAVFINRDYTPFSQNRDRILVQICRQFNISLHQYADQLLNEPESVLKADETPYRMFTPYYRKAKEYRVEAPAKTVQLHFDVDISGTLLDSRLSQYLQQSLPGISAGCDGAQRLLSDLGRLDGYDQSRDLPGMDGTSGLSAHLRFGTCSVRDVYHRANKDLQAPEAFKRQLYWRDFYHHIGHHFPHVYQRAFQSKYDALQWDHNPDALAKWCTGKTGFPIVDAGMRELAATGTMHNRARMIVASFLTKNLHIDWREGEKHFARLLVDFDPALNNGNWQWSASTGCDAQPYFRVFNPWRQQRRYDKDCTYIKRWIPELSPYSAREIHGLEKKTDIYLPPIADLRLSSEESKRRFKRLSSQN